MKHYFLRLAFVGMISEFVVALLMLKKLFLEIMQFNDGAISVCLLLSLIFGGLATILMAKYLDRLEWKHSHWKAMIPGPLLIFLAGIVVGSLVSFLGHSLLVEKESLLNYSNFFDYFFKTLFWFSYFGIPCCLILGSIYRVFVLTIVKKLQKKGA